MIIFVIIVVLVILLFLLAVQDDRYDEWYATYKRDKQLAQEKHDADQIYWRRQYMLRKQKEIDQVQNFNIPTYRHIEDIILGDDGEIVETIYTKEDK